MPDSGPCQPRKMAFYSCTYTLQDSDLKAIGGANSQRILCIECMSGLPKAGDAQFLRRT